MMMKDSSGSQFALWAAIRKSHLTKKNAGAGAFRGHRRGHFRGHRSGLLKVGPDRLTTTRVAERAGVSVGTLYQYFPNKDSLLFSVMEQHLSRISDIVEQSYQRNHGQPAATMIESVVHAFIDAKMERSDISTALYAATTGRKSTALINKVGKRSQAALTAMLATASDAQFSDLPFTIFILYSAMGGVMRAVLEADASPNMVRLLRKQLVLLGRGYLMSVAAPRQSRGRIRPGQPPHSRLKKGPSRPGLDPEPSAGIAYFHSKSLVFVLPSASASYSKTTAIQLKALNFGSRRRSTGLHDKSASRLSVGEPLSST